MARTTFPGLVLLDERFVPDTFDASGSTYTEAGAYAGVPEDQGASEMSLETAGTQTEDYAALVVRGGDAGLDDVGVVVALDADAGDEWRGWNPPTTITGFEALVYVAAANVHRLFDIARMADGLVALDFAGSQYVKAWRYESSTLGWVGPVTVYDHGTTYTTTQAHPTITADADGNPLAFWLVEDTAGTSVQVRVARSLNMGATWTVIQRSALRAPIDLGTYTISRMRAVQKGGEVLLLIAATDSGLSYPDVLLQYASTDGGLNFGLIDTWTGADEEHHGAYPSIAVAAGQFVVAYLRRTSSGEATTARPYVRRVGSAVTPLSGAEAVLAQDTGNLMRWATLTANAFDAGSGDCALSADENGMLWLVGRDVADDQQCLTFASLDGGDTWIDGDLGDGAGTATGTAWWEAQDASTHPKGMACAWWGGAMWVVHAFAANPGTGDDSLCMTQLGGWSRVELPLLTETSRHLERARWARTWLPFDTLDNTGATWTLTATGTPTVTLDTTTGALKIVGTAGEGAYWRATPGAGTLTEGVAAMVDMEYTDGDGVYVEVRAGVAGPSSYRVRVTLDGSGIDVTDKEAASSIGTETVNSGRVQMLMWVGNDAAAPSNDGQVRVWVREPTAITGTREWREVVQTATLTKGTDTTHRVEVGVVTAVADTEAYLRLVQFTSDEDAGLGWYDAINPTTMVGRALTGAWSDVNADGLRMRATAGPGRKGDAWLLPVAHTYAIENVHWGTDPSPRRHWKSSSSDGTGVTLDWLFPAAWRGWGTSRSLGVYLDGNFGAAEIHLRNPAGVWVKYADVVASSGQTGLAWACAGAIVTPDTGTAVASYAWGDHELAGDYIELDNGVGSVVRTIRTNGNGAWSAAAGVQRVHVELADADGTEPATGTDAKIRSRRTLTIINDASAYRGLRLVIPAQETAEGYHILRAVHIGPVVLFAHPYTSSRDEGFEAHTVLTDSPSGARRSRVMAEPTRYVEFGFEEGLMPTLAHGSTPAPRGQGLYTSGPGIASPDLASYQTTGIYQRINGSDRPVVYFSSLDVQQSSSTEVVIVQPRRLLRGRVVTEEIKRTTVRGEEDSATLPEVHRLSRVRISEEP